MKVYVNQSTGSRGEVFFSVLAVHKSRTALGSPKQHSSKSIHRFCISRLKVIPIFCCVGHLVQLSRMV